MGSCISKQPESSNEQSRKTDDEIPKQIPHLKLYKQVSSVRAYAHKTEKMLSFSQINSKHNTSQPQTSSVQSQTDLNLTLSPNTAITSNTPVTANTPFTPYTPNTTNTPIAPSPISPAPMSPITPIQADNTVINSDYNSDVAVSEVKHVAGLYEIFTSYATNDNKTKMDIDGLSEALSVFGMHISKNKNLQSFIWNKFDLEGEKEIDYNDFMATMSSLIGTRNEDSLFLMFQIFDLNEHGFLDIGQLADMLLAQQKLSMSVTKQCSANTVSDNNVKQQCLNKAQNMMAKTKINGKVSFNEYFEMMMNSVGDCAKLQPI